MTVPQMSPAMSTFPLRMLLRYATVRVTKRLHRPTDLSTNVCSCIGSHLLFDMTRSFDENLSMDPVFVQDLSTDVHHYPNSTAAGQTNSVNSARSLVDLRLQPP